MIESAPKNMVKKNSFQNNWMRMSGAILFATLLIPTPAQAMCNGPESCGILGGFLLSILTVPISLMALFLAIWPATLSFFRRMGCDEIMLVSQAKLCSYSSSC